MEDEFDDIIGKITAKQLAAEQARFDIKNRTIISICRKHYDDWTEKLFPILQDQQIGCYDYLIRNVFNDPSVGIDTNIKTLASIFATIRKERGVQRLTRSNQPYKVGSSKSVTQATDLVSQNAQRVRYSQPTNSGNRLPIGKDLAASESRQVAPNRAGEAVAPARAVSAPGASYGMTWTVQRVDGHPVLLFEDHELNARKPLVSAVRDIEPQLFKIRDSGDSQAILEALAFLKALYDFKNGTASLGDGLELNTTGWSDYLVGLVVQLKAALKVLAQHSQD